MCWGIFGAFRPLFAQKSRKDGHIGVELRRALEWWLAILHQGAALCMCMLVSLCVQYF